MITPSAKDEAYAVFLSGSDLDTWSASLEAYRDVLDGALDVRQARPVDILRAATLCIYVAWLSGRYGDDERGERTMKQLHELSDRLTRIPPLPGVDGEMVPIVIAAAKGYHATARMLAEKMAKSLPVEIALLVMPPQSTPKAAMLDPFIGDGVSECFVPALFFFGSALLDLGYQSNTKALLDRHRSAASSSLIRDLRGQLFELEGSWDEAREEYRQSGWPSHTYRTAICDLILGESVESFSSWPPEKVTRFAAGMLDFSAETDRAGVLRSASFVRACRWSGFDNWLVHFELARLAFQRRHHAEAEAHFAAALRTTPEPYRFAVCASRFTNLTWLGAAVGVSLTAETLEAGYAALLEPATERQKSSIRTWLGGSDKDPAVLDPVATTTDGYEIAKLHKIRGSVPEALASWCRALNKGYTPRALFELLEEFAAHGFEHTASKLGEIVALEAEGSFFDSLELAQTITSVLETRAPTRVAGIMLERVLAEVDERLEKLIESEFQNAIRAFEYFLKRRLRAPAGRVLARAERLAEGSEELLLLAIARRNAAGGGWDPRALEALHEAQRQSTDRFERLLIAKELAQLGDLGNARVILNEEQVLSDKQDLTPIEYVLALQCSKACLTPSERTTLEASAIDALRRDVEAGRFVRYGRRFADRLDDENIKATLEIKFPTRDAVTDVETSTWKKLIDQLAGLERQLSGEQELHLLNAKVAEVRNTESPFARIALWGLHLDRFDALLRVIDQLRPRVADDEMPMARDVSPRRTGATQLARGWRAYLGETTSVRATAQLDEIRAILEQDRYLTARWDQLRNVEAEKPSTLALTYADHGAALLADIVSDTEWLAAWPSFLGIREAIVEDGSALAARIHERAVSLRERVTA